MQIDNPMMPMNRGDAPMTQATARLAAARVNTAWSADLGDAGRAGQSRPGVVARTPLARQRGGTMLGLLLGLLIGTGAAAGVAWYIYRSPLPFITPVVQEGNPSGLKPAPEVPNPVPSVQPQAGQLPSTLSSGQRRRLALATAFVRPRRLLVLDEPEQRLDVEGVEWLGTRLKAELQDGLAIVLASHEPSLLAAIGAREVRLGERR